LRAGPGANKQTQDHANHVVQSLRSKLATTSHTFKDILEVRTTVRPAARARRAACTCLRPA